MIDATGHVVAPGFIDLHEHGQHDESYRMMVRDGVTSAFELEVGTADVAAWYAARERGQIVNHGVSIGHIPVRMKVLGDPGTGLAPAGIGGSGTATEAQMVEMEGLLRKGLADGAVAAGFGSAYTPGAPMSEIERMFRVAAEGGASVHIHMRGGLPGLHETIAAAKAARAPLHIVHVNSVAGDAIDGFFAAIKAARAAGQDVTTEAYPYGAGHDGDHRRRCSTTGSRGPTPTLRAAPARVDRRAPHARHLRGRRARQAARSSSTTARTHRRVRPSSIRWPWSPVMASSRTAAATRARPAPTPGCSAGTSATRTRVPPDGRAAADDAVPGATARSAGAGDEAARDACGSAPMPT